MQMILDILYTLLPIFLCIGIGAGCRRLQVVGADVIVGLRGLISTFLIPAVIFKAFYLIQIDRSAVQIVAVVFVVLLLGMLLGYPLRRLFGTSGYAVPFLTTTYEGGMLGYALFAMVMGQEHLQYYAQADLSVSLFLFTVYMMLVMVQNSGSFSVRQCWDFMRRSPSFWAIVLGLGAGISGLGQQAAASPVGYILENTLEFLTSPVGPMILIIIGYDFELDPRVTLRALKMLLSRYAIQLVLAAAAFAVLHKLNALDPYSTVALTLQFLMPPSFMVSVMLDMEEDTKAFVSSFLSISTIVGILLFLLVRAWLLN